MDDGFERGEARVRKVRASIAEALGLTPSDLDGLEYWIDPQLDGDGVITGFNIYFGEGSDAEVLARIPGLMDGRWVRIGSAAIP